MANATTTYGHRQRLAGHFYNNAALPLITHIAFGSGGHNPENGAPLAEDPAAAALANEMLRKPLNNKYQEDAYSVTAVGRVEKNELTGVTISEVGLLDAEGNLVGFKNMAAKILGDDEYFEVKIKLKF
jgi:hypothetical protein